MPYGKAVPVARPNEAQEVDAIAKSKKYFHEPGTDDILGHYDQRFFHGIVDYEEKGNTQYHMIRAYLSAFQDLGLETWIAHGTLLGWWWNGEVHLHDLVLPRRPALIHSSADTSLGLGHRYPSLRLYA